ncbi:hypothetical protein [Loigolactobacillus rennini]|uniref:DUF5067 domain-containing protein n=1 Tax=Loigolactobacillus rennini DSM 20253 TaxID=1423796 RepID=A0A0R2CV83_9LACO|nr:hypothetical protein [Loigolactobacillus rennini]KRM95693.1 hypothetical protein FC24_GL002026 [Loigolactobacillus rennini DSM 20253]
MKKASYLTLLVCVLGLLGACTAPGAKQENASTTNSQVKQQSQSQSANSISGRSLLTNNGKESRTLLPATWQFDEFAITAISGELDDKQQLELEINWRNGTQDPRRFSDVAEVTVYQANQKLPLIERDDDFADTVRPQRSEDFELNFRLNNQKQALKIVITPQQGKARTLMVDLQ